MSVLGDSCASIAPSVSVTTGQGEEGLGTWMPRGSSYHQPGRLGNGRAPPPTCNIPVPRESKIFVPVSNNQSWTANLADNLMGDMPCHPQELQPSVGGKVASGSLESTTENIELSNREECQPLEEADDDSQQGLSEISDEDDAEIAARTSKGARSGLKRGRKGKEKKKVGRPIAYRGDPNAPELTDQERRRIKRRIANRESARRVRHKRQEELEDMQIKMEQIQARNSHLQQHVAHMKQQKDMLCGQLEDMESKYEKVTIENKQLAIEIQALRQSLQLKMSVLEDELDKRANEAEHTMGRAGFANSQLGGMSCFSGAPTHPTTDAKAYTSLPLDWFPSLNLDDPRGLEMVQPYFDDPTVASSSMKRETFD